MKSFKTLSVALFALLFTVAVNAQTQPAKPTVAKTEWKELKDFHSVMSKTFHPSEEDNLQPLKDNASDLVTKARVWQASPIPADYNKELTAKTLRQLVSKCEEIKESVYLKKSDADLKKLIGEAHDIFHTIVEKCSKTEHEEEKK